MTDETVAIVGGSRGLGLQLAREAAKRGARVGLCARDERELEAARAELQAAGASVATAYCDVREDGSPEAALREIEGALGPIDALINVAGIISVGPLEALALSDFQAAMETNFFGVLRTTLAVLPAMRARRSGRIVNVTSIGGEIAVPHLLPYCASKFACVGFSDGLRSEVARDGVRVTTVVAGLMRTGSPPRVTAAGQTKKEYALFALADATPLTSVSVEHAAAVIMRACERGRGRVVISWQAKLALLADRAAPNLVRALMTLTGRLLPRGGERPEHRPGSQSESALTRSPLTALSKEASQTQNETLSPPEAEPYSM